MTMDTVVRQTWTEPLTTVMKHAEFSVLGADLFLGP